MNTNGIDERDGVLAAIGQTPLVRLSRLFQDARFSAYAKLEALNPGGSTKDRPAALMIERGIERKRIGRDTVVIESSSGNMGIGLAQACAYYGVRFICVTDIKTTPQNLQILKAYGAEIDCVTEPDPETGEFLPARLKRVQALLSSVKNGFWPNQYASRDNSDAHCQTTMREIAEACDGQVDYLFCATSTCGTIRGCAEYVKAHGLPTRIIAVDAVGSLIFSTQQGTRYVPGLGAGLRPPLCPIDMVDRCIHVSDVDCIVGGRRLIRREAIFAGGSSGGVVMAVERMIDEIPDGAVCALILPDRGERYLDTLFNDDWVRDHFGDVTHLWQEPQAAYQEEPWQTVAF